MLIPGMLTQSRKAAKPQTKKEITFQLLGVLAPWREMLLLGIPTRRIPRGVKPSVGIDWAC